MDSKNAVYFLDKNGILWKIDPDANNLRQLSHETAAFANAELIISRRSKNIALLNKTDRTAWLFDDERGTFLLVAKNVSYALFSPDENKLLLANERELYSYFLKETFDPERKPGDKELITRLSTDIENSWWHQDSEHVIFSSAGRLEAIELDGRATRNSAEIIKDFDAVYYAQGSRELFITNGNNLSLVALPKAAGLIAF